MTPIASVARDFSELVLFLDPARTDLAREHAQVVERVTHVKERLEELRRRWTGSADGLGSIDAASRALGELLAPSPDGVRHRAYAQLAQCYERLVRALDSAPGAPVVPTTKLSPKNLARNLFHVAGGTTAALVYHFLLTQAQAIALMAVIAGTFTALEIGRRVSPRVNDLLMRFFSVIARPHEYYRTNSATIFAYGLLFAAALFPKAAVEVGCVVLAIGDPVASNVGKRWGRKKLYKDKSYAGTFGFIVAGALAATAYLAILHPEIAPAVRVYVAAVAALAGAAAELLGGKIDDNLLVPLTTALAVTTVLA